MTTGKHKHDEKQDHTPENEQVQETDGTSQPAEDPTEKMALMEAEIAGLE